MKTTLFRSILTSALLGIAAAGSLCAMNGGEQKTASSYEKEPSIALLQAARANDLNAIRDIQRVLNGRQLDDRHATTEIGNWNALHYAAAANNVEMFKLIRTICPTLANHKNRNGQYPIEFFPSFLNKLRCIPHIKKAVGLLIGLGMFWFYRILDYVSAPSNEGFVAANSHLGLPSCLVAILPLVYIFHELHIYHDPAPVTRPL